MRLDSLIHKDLPADAILIEIGVPKEERQVILEFLPLIPVALWAGGAAWTAYDTYQAKKQLDAGEITQAQFAARVGTDVALGVAGGVLGKAVGKGFKVGKEIYKTKKAARAAQKKTADIPTPKDAAVPPKGINVVSNATTTTAKTSSKKAVQTAKPGDTIKTDKGEFLAGVDGKATTTRVSAPNAAEIKKEILKISDTSASSAATVVTTKSVSKTLDKLAGKVDPALQKAADAAKSAASQTIDKAKDVIPKVTKTTVDKVKKIGSKTTSYSGGSTDDIARNYVKTSAKSRMKDLDPIGKKAFVKSIEKSYPGIAKELNLDKLIAPAASLTNKTVNKTVKKQVTKKQRDALSNMGTPTASLTNKTVNKTVKNQLTKKQRDALSNMGAPAASLTTKGVNKTVKKQLTKKQRDALSNMGTPISVAVTKGAGKKLTKTQRDALSGTGKYKAVNKKPSTLAPTSSAAVKAAGKRVDDLKVKAKGNNKTANTTGKTTGKTASRTSRLLRALRGNNGGDYYDTDLTGVIKRHMRNT